MADQCLPLHCTLLHPSTPFPHLDAFFSRKVPGSLFSEGFSSARPQGVEPSLPQGRDFEGGDPPTRH